MKRFMMVMLTCLISQTAWAGWVVTYKDAESGERSQEFYDRGKANFGGLIFTDKYVLLADKGARAYWKGTPDQYCNAVKAQMQKIKAQVAGQMAQLYAEHPEYKSVPISQKKVTRKKIGTRTIADFSATGYAFFIDNIGSGEIWVSTDPGLSGIIDFGRSMEKKLKCFEGLNDNSNLEDSALYKQTVKGAFLLKESHRQVVSVERKNIPSGVFEVPGRYKRFRNYQKFYDYISNASRSSSRATSRPSAAPPSFDMPSRQRPSSARSESRPSSNDDMDRPGKSTGDDQMPNMDDIKKGAGEMLKSLGGLFGN